MSNWTLFSNHGHVLVCLARDSEARLRDVAAAVGITERAVQKIVRDLQQSGMISVSKQGRRNQYRIHRKAGLRHELEAGSTIGGLIDFVSGKRKPGPVTRQVSVEKRQIAEKSENTRVETAKQIAEKSIEPAAPVHAKPASDKHKEVADTGALVEKDKVSGNDKASKKAKEKSDIEKQQGSLF